MSVGGSDRNDEFHQQLRLQELYGKREGEAGGDGNQLTYTDPSDGAQYEWDAERKAWFPKVRGEGRGRGRGLRASRVGARRERPGVLMLPPPQLGYIG